MASIEEVENLPETQEREAPPLSLSDPRYVNIGGSLPSQLIFYPFTHISIRPFSLAEYKKLAQANTLNSVEMVLETVNACIDKDVRLLTEGDLSFLMFWLRINSYKKMPYTYKVTCTNLDHITSVQLGDMEADSLENTVQLNTTNQLEINEVQNPEGILDEVIRLKDEYGLNFTAPRMGLIVEFQDLIEAMEKKVPGRKGITNRVMADLEWDFKYAALLGDQHGITLKEKMEAWKAVYSNPSTPPEIIPELEDFLKMIDHGVDEKINTTCRGCGAEIVTKVTFQAPNFFPNIH